MYKVQSVKLGVILYCIVKGGWQEPGQPKMYSMLRWNRGDTQHAHQAVIDN